MSAYYLHTCVIEPQPLDYEQLLTGPMHSILFAAEASLDVRVPIQRLIFVSEDIVKYSVQL
jgi:hypothetical protein